MVGYLKVAFCREAAKLKACEELVGASVGYFIHNDTCVPLTKDESRPPATVWTMNIEGPAGIGQLVEYFGDNSSFFSYSTNFIFTCDDENDAKAEASYNPVKYLFNVTVKTRYACKMKIGEMTMTFHHYRYFIMAVCMSLGLFINYFGIYKIKKTLILFGFVLTFFFSLFFFTAIFHSCELISREHLQYDDTYDFVDSAWWTGWLRV